MLVSSWTASTYADGQHAFASSLENQVSRTTDCGTERECATAHISIERRGKAIATARSERREIETGMWTTTWAKGSRPSTGKQTGHRSDRDTTESEHLAHIDFNFSTRSLRCSINGSVKASGPFSQPIQKIEMQSIFCNKFGTFKNNGMNLEMN